MIQRSNCKNMLNLNTQENVVLVSNSLSCPKGCRGSNISRDGNVMCGSCGLVLKQEEFENEYYGGNGFDF